MTVTDPAAWIGWDWADRNHDLFVQTAEGHTEKVRLPNRPDKLHAWLKELSQRFQKRKVIVCLEASRSALLPILLEYAFMEIYLVNPKSLARFRDVVRPSGSKSDALDCQLACQLVKSHQPLLPQYVPEDPLTQELGQLVRYRRDLVNQRSALANQLTSVLKLYYPLALEMLQHDTTSALAANFVLNFPTLQALQDATLHQVRKFFLGQGCRLTEGLQERLEMIAAAVPVSSHAHWNNPNSFMACALADQLKPLAVRIQQLEERIGILAEQHPNHSLARSLPGAAAALEPRLMVALGTHPEACDSPETIAIRSGIAPRRFQSGNTSVISRRLAKPQFLHQTWIEFAKCSVLQCEWARQFVQAKRKAGKSYYSAIRALAYKWIRILHACWKSGTDYDEARYLQSLRKNHSPFAAQAAA